MDIQYFQETANTIMRQLRATQDRRIMCMSWGLNAAKWGVDSLLGYQTVYLQFRVRGHIFSGRVRVYHNSLDYYTIVFMAVKSDTETRERIEDVDCEQLTYVLDAAIENPKGGYHY